MSLTQKDLQAIKELVKANNEVLLAKAEIMIDDKLEEQTKDIAQVINQVVIAVDARVSKLEREVEKIKIKLSLA